MYERLISPLEDMFFEEMNKKQVVQYFEWFMETKSERIRYLEEYVQKKGGVVVFDYSPESLIDLWIWFKDKISWEEETAEEIENRLKASPDWMKSHILENTKKLSTQTHMIAVDISIYFGECFIKNNPTIYWGYITRPKNLVDVNKPSLVGFKGNGSVFPYRLISVCIGKCSKKWNDRQIYETYQKWCNNI